MNELRNRSIRKFNPGTLQSDKEMIDQFVVRKHELDIVLEVLRGNIDSSSCQHVLVVAPRGRGKTMLLARVASELCTDKKLSAHLLSVRFMEESPEIFNLADFWLETLFHLARESTTHDPKLARELRETHAALTARWREQALEEHARAAVMAAVDRLGKKLVLMVENLHELSENVDEDFGWKLRCALQSEPQIMLLATATSCFEGLDDAQQPFFELFRLVDLQRLNTDECRRLWQVVSGDTVSGRDIRPLEILTGGSPRLLVIVAGFARHRSLRQLMEELVQLIDEHTEYFRSNLEVLGKTERRVYVAVIDLWQASRTGEIAARARMDVRTVSTMLGRLVDRGAVMVEGSGKKRLYAASEPLYSIYYKLRRERDESALVENLMRFMAVFYSEAELAEMSGMMMAEAAQSKAIREGIKKARAELPQIDSVFSSMAWLGSEGLSNQAETIDNEVVERFGGSDALAFQARVAKALVNKGVARGRLGDVAASIAACDEIIERFGGSHVPALQEAVARALLNKGVTQRKLGDVAATIVAYDELIERFGASDALALQEAVAGALLNKGVAQGKLGDVVAAIAACDEVIERFGGSAVPELQVRVAKALVNKGVVQGQLGDVAAAIAAYDEVKERFGGSAVPELQVEVARALINKGVAQGQLGDCVAAIAAFDEIIERFGGSDVPEFQEAVARALVNKGVAQGQLGDVAAEIAACDEVVERFGGSDVPELQEAVARALINKGVEQRQLGDFAAAIAACDEVVERFGASDALALQGAVAGALINKGVAQEQLGDFMAAIAPCDEIIERFGGSAVPELQARVAKALVNKGVVQGHLGDFAATITTCDEIIERFGGSAVPELQVEVAKALINKGVAQRQLGDFAAAIAACDKVVERFGGSDVSELQEVVVSALINKGMDQTEIGRAEEALHTCKELEQRRGILTGDERLVFEWRVKWVRTKALLLQEKHGAAMDTFRSAYAVFVPGDETMMREMLWLVPDLIAAGASEHDLVEILSSDRAKSDTLLPLVVALRQRNGEAVRAPAEVLEVAVDIRERIEAKTAKGPSS